MADIGRELAELRRDVIESRNQTIKSDNQIRNLALDVKGFENRFDSLERRTRWVNLGLYVLVAVSISVAAFFVSQARTEALRAALESMEKELQEARVSVNAVEENQESEKSRLIETERHRETMRVLANQLLDKIKTGQINEAVKLLDKVDFTSLSSLERRLLEEELRELKVSEAGASYERARQAIDRQKYDDAILELKRVLIVDPEGKRIPQARYLLAETLMETKQYEEVLGLIEQIEASTRDRSVLEDVHYWRGVSQAGLGQYENAMRSLREVAEKPGKYRSEAKELMDELEESKKSQIANPASADQSQNIE